LLTVDFGVGRRLDDVACRIVRPREREPSRLEPQIAEEASYRHRALDHRREKRLFDGHVGDIGVTDERADILSSAHGCLDRHIPDLGLSFEQQ
jgi:hypothetical protein